MPDFATCNFLHLLAVRFPTLPMFGLFDCDPDGIGIFAEYKYGNAKSAQHKTALPRLQLLGLNVADAQKAGVFEKSKLPLSKRDHARIRNILESEIGQKDAVIRSATQGRHDAQRAREARGETAHLGSPLMLFLARSCSPSPLLLPRLRSSVCLRPDWTTWRERT